IVADGAGHSHGALEVTGEVGAAIQARFAGTNFLPNATADEPWDKMGYMDYSKKQTLRFFARGDGHDYVIVFLGPVMNGIPPMYGFTAGTDWQEVSVPLQAVQGLDLKRVKVI